MRSDDVAPSPRPHARAIATAIEDRVSRSLTLERFQLRHAAEDALKGLEAISHSIASGVMTRVDALCALEGWARAIAPIMPKTSAELITAIGADRVPLRLPCSHDSALASRSEELSNV